MSCSYTPCVPPYPRYDSPLMDITFQLVLHSASKNFLRIPRIITNPPVALREPFNFNRENPDDYSLVERKTLAALGIDKLDFR